jgi:hypothetical protein
MQALDQRALVVRDLFVHAALLGIIGFMPRHRMQARHRLSNARPACARGCFTFGCGEPHVLLRT